MGGYITSRTLPFLRICSLCNAPRKTLYEVPIDGTIYLFCSLQEARIGLENFKKNASLLGLSETPLTDHTDIQEDTVQESQSNEI